MKLFQYKNSNKTAVVVAVMYLVVFFFAAYGWIANFVKFVGILADPIGTMFVARLVGIFAVPLGVVLGFV